MSNQDDNEKPPADETVRQRRARELQTGQLSPETVKGIQALVASLRDRSTVLGQVFADAAETNRQQLEWLLKVKEAQERSARDLGRGIRSEIETKIERAALEAQAVQAAIANTERMGELNELTKTQNELTVDLLDAFGGQSRTAKTVGVLLVLGTLDSIVIAIISLVVSLSPK